MTLGTSAYVGLSGQQGVLKLVGDVRYPAAPAIERAMHALFQPGACDAYLVDLREAGHIDSTMLGLVARVGAVSLKICGRRAVLACAEVETLATLRACGFDEVFVLVDAPPDEPEGLAAVRLTPAGGRELGETMLEAHRELMDVSERMRRELEPSVRLLEDELSRDPE